MLVVRAIEETDVDGLLDLAQQAGEGMTTLKPDRVALAQRVEISCASFAQTIALPQRDYLFVMEDTSVGRLVGVCAIKAAVGLDEPFYNYRIGTLVHSSNELGIFTRMETLYLANDLTGCAELCSLFLHPEYRSGTNGKLLSKSRLIFMAQFPDLFPEKVFAEMRGFQNSDGSSPFWENLGEHFFHMEFCRADALSSGKKSFIAELMPRHPLYIDYLPKEARDVIGKTHSATVPARRMLEQEGLNYEGYVDIFDGGPVLIARIADLRALRKSSVAALGNADADEDVNAPPILVSTTDLANFRVVVSQAQCDVAGHLLLRPEQQQALACNPSSTVRTLLLNP